MTRNVLEASISLKASLPKLLLTFAGHTEQHETPDNSHHFLPGRYTLHPIARWDDAVQGQMVRSQNISKIVLLCVCVFFFLF